MDPLDNIPSPGFYYHYKHDPNGPLNNYAYEVIGVGHHTEEDIYMVVYRPLYEEARVYKEGKLFDLRPLEMFMENVAKDGKTFSRFEKITDAAVIARLEIMKERMYGSMEK